MQTSVLTPIPDDVPSTLHSGSNGNATNVSESGIPHVSQPQLVPSKPNSNQTPQQSYTDPSRVIRQGHLRLVKTISGVKQWKTVWMVLRNQSLNVYKSNSESFPIIVVPMYSIIDAAEIDQKHKPNCFQIICEEKTYRLQAESENELENWLGAFKSVLVKQEAEKSSRHASMSLTSPPVPPGQNLSFTSRLSQLPPSRDDERTSGNALASSVQSLNILDKGGHYPVAVGGTRVHSGVTAHSLAASPGRWVVNSNVN